MLKITEKRRIVRFLVLLFVMCFSLNSGASQIIFASEDTFLEDTDINVDQDIDMDEQMQRKLLNQETSIVNYNILLNNLDDSLYAGAYINDNGILVVLLLEESAENVKGLISGFDEIDLRYIEYDFAKNGYSNSELQAALDFVYQYSDELSIFSGGTDVFNNVVIVRQDPDVLNSKQSRGMNPVFDFLALNGLEDIVEIEFAKAPEILPSPESLLDVELPMARGISFTEASPINNGVNKASISVRVQSGETRYLYSAGHPFNNNDIIYVGSTRIGKVVGRIYNGYGDSVKIQLDDGMTYTSVYTYGYSTAVLPAGTSVSQYGAASGLITGAVIGSNNDRLGTLDQVYRTNKVMRPGDSGGSLLSGNISYGMLHGGIEGTPYSFYARMGNCLIP